MLCLDSLSTAMRSRACLASAAVSMSWIEGGERLTVSGEESDSCAFAARTSGSANSMHVILRVVGVVIVENMSDIAHILMIG
jgi:hypothetical protein